MEHDVSPLATAAIKDYLLLRQSSAGYASTRGRLALAVEFIAAIDPGLTCAALDVPFADRFRAWLAAKPVAAGRNKDGEPVTRKRSLSHVEQCVMQLAAAINATPGQQARFGAVPLKSVARSPSFRADIPTMAAMFRYCLYPEPRKGRGIWRDEAKQRDQAIAERSQLLRYLRAAVATWARPEEIYDLAEGQWLPSPRVIDLNPPGRRQTRKYRGRIVAARQFVPHLDAMQGRYMGVASVRSTWAKARAYAGCPDLRGEAAEKLIRRSMATLVRKAIGEAQWQQGRMWLGHVKADTSDIYALPDPANLGLALAATESIIEEIEALVPGAYRAVTALKLVVGSENG